jgi:hypothetical protein
MAALVNLYLKNHHHDNNKKHITFNSRSSSYYLLSNGCYLLLASTAFSLTFELRDMETTLPKPTAYQKWLFMQSEGHPVKLADLIVSEVMQQNRAAFELLEMTGDVEYTAETMIKAAKILCDICGEYTPDYKIMPL